MSNKFAVILAAGQGTRMKSQLYKVLHPVCGKPMVQHVVDEVTTLGLSEIVTIVGHGAEKVKDQLGQSVTYALQEEQLGTGHAVMQAATLLEGKEGTTLVLCGDTPLITKETMKALLELHEKEDAKVSILTARTTNPTGYGRIVRSEDGFVERIVEQKDATEEEQQIQEINTGTYCFDNIALFNALKKVTNENAQGEYYLPDVIEILQQAGENVVAYQTPIFEETLGVNDRVALAEAEKVMKQRINESWMKQGVTIIDPAATYIEKEVIIGQDTVLYPGTMIRGNSEIGSGCIIGPHSEILSSTIGDKTEVKQSVVRESHIGSGVAVGPFAHIRPESNIGNDVKVGNFVEIKKSNFGNGSKAPHLSYIGDAEIGDRVNLGCGSITVNYDGTNKHKTKVGDDAFVGCNSNLVAPVTVGKNAYIAAGSTVTDNVPDSALSIARSRQTNKEGYVQKIKEKKNNDK
ncbi:bifunctional UDP-N-acetylglucosamine diphosphorylase/glucosamine-1-phosphate N-acetyltransferase GlmU [Alkalihalobacillus sp. LMS39]|uniref:bifunctional UDP-N-acetylglucosamine diphosphorylase/glucosamine-1-phosphate N-acetyltransferase GlmU n=1 Tax=Alkalihalobacillus sp. LMS39 TaxID=2924032 RepID=UPI001FB55D29|nr:bifunctional UDP-N-acetylglucosamine diphosphorylase/glucosamine-1-phosphate N-acetyltransferase GlmU [Alkalihalobacillus sp. LMS39]UOE94189.1 bifunctional UDP-N-acetylglucosamine diphosphorylase/glucosamine-1-phosphate N-acetyltransferase GlmU [Alkalihalobacillus sp. LMS39]